MSFLHQSNPAWRTPGEVSSLSRQDVHRVEGRHAMSIHTITVSTRHKDPLYYVSAVRAAAVTHRFIKLSGLEFAVVTLVDTILLHQQLHSEWQIVSIRTDYKDINSKVTGQMVKKIHLEVILQLQDSE